MLLSHQHRNGRCGTDEVTPIEMPRLRSIDVVRRRQIIN
jgi:hypothetical protein